MATFLFVVVVVILTLISFVGLVVALDSEKLWSPVRMPLRERFEPQVVIGFLCFFGGIGILATPFLAMIF